MQEYIDRFPETVSNQDQFGVSALHEPAGAGWVDPVKMLLKAGASPSIKDEAGRSPFYYAAKADHMSIVTMLLKRGDNSGYPVEGHKHEPYGGNTFLCRDDTNSLRIFPVCEDKSDPSQLEMAFYDAATAGYADVVQQLVNDRENIRLERHGTKALLVAIEQEHEEVLEILLREGVSPSYPDGSPAVQIPLHQAVRRGNLRIASRLLDFGANLQTRDNHRRTALFEALHGSEPDEAALLLINGINTSATDDTGNTALHKAVEKGLLEHASLLIDKGMKVNACNDEGVTPLHLASEYGHYHIFRLLIYRGADVNAVTSHTNETPLMYIVCIGSISIAMELSQMLLRRGANINAVSSDKKTPLMLAADAGHREHVEKLLDNGADPKLAMSAPRGSSEPAAGVGHALIQQVSEARDAYSQISAQLEANTG